MIGFIYHNDCWLYHITIMDLHDTIITLLIVLHIAIVNDVAMTLQDLQSTCYRLAGSTLLVTGYCM